MCVRVFVCLSIYGWGKRQIHSLWKIATRGCELPGSSRNCYIYKIVLKKYSKQQNHFYKKRSISHVARHCVWQQRLEG